MNIEELSKKYFNPSEEEDSESLASSTSDLSFTVNKKEVKIETSVISNDSDSLNDLIKSIEKHDEIKLDESLKEKANEIYDYLKDSSESSNANESEKVESKSLDQSLNDSDLKKVADNLDNSQLNESVNESIPESDDSELKQVAKNLEAAMNDSLNDSSLEEHLEPQTKEAVLNKSLNESQNSEPEVREVGQSLSQLVNEIIAPLDLVKAETDNESDKSSASTAIEKTSDEQQSPLAQIMQIVTGLAALENTEEKIESADQSMSESTEEAVLNSSENEQKIEAQSVNKGPEQLTKDVKLDDLMEFSQSASEQLTTPSEEVKPVNQQSETDSSISEDLNNSIEEQHSDIQQEVKQQEANLDESQNQNTETSEELNTSNEEPLPLTKDIQFDDLIKEAVQEVKACQEPIEGLAQPIELKAELIEEVKSSQESSPSTEEEIIQQIEGLAQPIELKAELIEEVKSSQEPSPTSEEQIIQQIEGLAQPIELKAELIEDLNTSQESTPISEEKIIEKIACLSQEIELKSNELIQEVRQTYLIDGEKIEAVGCSLYKPDEILMRKEEILNKYKISNEQFELCREFFNEKQEDSLLKNSLLRILMREALKTRNQVKASDEDVDRALEAVDEDKDDKITFDELVQLLLLFFSSKSNVEKRIGNVLKAKLSSESLSSNDAVEFVNFLSKFYGREQSGEEFKDGLNVAEFLKDILPSLSSLAFVQPEEEEASKETDESLTAEKSAEQSANTSIESEN